MAHILNELSKYHTSPISHGNIPYDVNFNWSYKNQVIALIVVAAIAAASIAAYKEYQKHKSRGSILKF